MTCFFTGLPRSGSRPATVYTCHLPGGSRQNLHLLSGDPFSKILAWYTEKLGKFRDASSKKGQQALWNDKTPEGRVRMVTISTIGAPEGKVKITLMTGMLRK